MSLPTEPIGSIPRPADLLAAINAYASGKISRGQLLDAEQAALRDTIALFERTGSPSITDGEQTKPSFATYPLSGLGNQLFGTLALLGFCAQGGRSGLSCARLASPGGELAPSNAAQNTNASKRAA